jgi:hypothetical protein
VLHIISPEIGPAGPCYLIDVFSFEGDLAALKDQQPSLSKDFISIPWPGDSL